MLSSLIIFVAGVLVGGVGVALVFRKNNAKALAAINSGVVIEQKLQDQSKK